MCMYCEKPKMEKKMLKPTACGVTADLRPNVVVAEIEQSEEYKEYLAKKSDYSFYIANYGTNENIEIFQSFDKAQNFSIDGKVHYAQLDSELVYLEEFNSGVEWNYEDKADLFVSSPVEVLKEVDPADVSEFWLSFDELREACK